MALEIVIGIIGVGYLLLYLKNLIPEDHWLFSNMIMMFVPLIFIQAGAYMVSIATGSVQESIVTSFYVIMLWFARLFYAYVIFALFYVAINSFDFQRLRIKKR